MFEIKQRLRRPGPFASPGHNPLSNFNCFRARPTTKQNIHLLELENGPQSI